MNITKQSADGLNGIITIALTPADYQQELKDSYKQYSKRLNIPGFRPGTAPIGMVKRMVGKSAVIDVVTRIVQNQLNSYLDNENIALLGEPLPTEQKDDTHFDEDGNNDIEFSFEIGIAPNVELNLNFPKPIVQYDITVDDAFMQEQIERLRIRFGKTENPETVAVGDFVYGKLTEAAADHTEDAAGFSRMIALNPERLTNPAFYAPITGLKLEDSTHFDFNLLGTDTEAIAKALFLEVEEVEDLRTKHLHFTVKRINRTGMAEMNEDFFKQVVGEARAAEVTDEASLKKVMEEDIIRQLNEEQQWVYRFQIRKQLEEQNPMAFPETFLRKWMLATQKEITEQNVDAEMPKMLKGTQWQILSGDIVEQNPELRVTNEDIEVGIRQEIRKILGGEAISPEKEQEYVTYMLKNEEIVRKHLNEMLNDRVYGFLESKTVTTKQSITASEFAALQLD